VSAVALSLTVIGGTAGRLSASRASGGNSFAAATIAAPSGFTATATSSTTATLTWTAPARLTGYTLAQSPGTLAGCPAAPSAATTSCTATGLSAGTAYTWTLTAVDGNWKSSSVTASATTFTPVGVTLLGKVTDGTSSSQSSTVTSVTTTSGADLLILVYRQGSNGNLGISSISGTAISGTPAQVAAQLFSNSKYELWAYRATGTGTAGGTVTVTFTAANNVTTSIDVVQLSGDKSGSPVAQAVGSSGSGTAATGAALPGASAADGEIFFTGLTTSTTMSTPTGYAALDAPTGLHGLWFSSSASSSAITTTLGTTSPYGTLEVEIAHA
jgi:hypothetical protein